MVLLVNGTGYRSECVCVCGDRVLLSVCCKLHSIQIRLTILLRQFVSALTAAAASADDHDHDDDDCMPLIKSARLSCLPCHHCLLFL